MTKKLIILASISVGIILFTSIFCCTGFSFLPTTTNESKSDTTKAITTRLPEKTSIEPLTTSKTKKVTSTPTATKTNLLIDSLQERPVMNGSNTERIGTYGRCIISKTLLTDEMLLEFDKFLETKDLNYVIIDFLDGTGLHGLDYDYTYTKIGKDSRGVYIPVGDQISSIFVYSDTNKVDWTDFKKFIK